ncbi:transcriptional activator of glycolytic enzymes-domain-containing protein [Chytridium lagenaria]|nr:transcriptional activator of glycolytic enzymes-domain-containing protein [Chytridium lagenaria]
MRDVLREAGLQTVEEVANRNVTQSTSQNIVTRINVNESTGTFDRRVQREEILGIEEGMNVERVDNIVPTYKMCGAITTVPFCWQEYKLGWNGGPALAELEDKYGAKWRRSDQAKKAFNRRVKIYTLIKDGVGSLSLTEKCGGSKARESSSRKRNDSHQVK